MEKKERAGYRVATHIILGIVSNSFFLFCIVPTSSLSISLTIYRNMLPRGGVLTALPSIPSLPENVPGAQFCR